MSSIWCFHSPTKTRARIRAPQSVQQQLRVLFGLSLLGVLLASAVSTTLFVAGWIRNALIAQAEIMVDKFAQNSVLVFYLQDAAIARSMAAAIQAFPSVKTVAFLDTAYRPIFRDLAAPSLSTLRRIQTLPPTDPPRWEDRAAIHLLRSVDTRPTKSPLAPTAGSSAPNGATTQRLGYLYVAIDQSPLRALTSTLFAIHSTIALVGGAILLFWLQRRLQRLLSPLHDLVMVMADAGQGPVRASLEGPAEIKQMAEVFNTMLERIENHKQILESEVTARTLELCEARDAALSASRMKSEFLAAVTHEMRTPLASIKGYTELALDELRFVENAAHTVERMKVVFQVGQELDDLIAQILEYAKAEAGKADVTVSAVDLNTLLQRVQELIAPLAKQNANAFHIAFTGEPHIAMDAPKLFHILLNLLSNAYKFTQSGRIEVTVDSAPEALRISVADTGIGIALDRQHLIFEPFRQLDMSDTRRYGGIGLGLAITKCYCEMLGGTIALESAPGIGSTFRIEIPLPIGSAIR